MKKWKYHRYCLRMPEMTPIEYEAVKAGMKANGFSKSHPILRFRGEIVDGRHRLMIAEELKSEGIDVKPVFEEWVPPEHCKTEEEIDAALDQFTITENALRRHATCSQFAQMIVREKGLADIPDDEISLSRIARETGVGRVVLSRARTIQRASPEMAADVEAGRVGYQKVYEQVKKTAAKPPPPPKRTIETEPEDEIVTPTKEAIAGEFRRIGTKLGELVTLLSRTSVFATALDKRLGNGGMFLRTIQAAHDDVERWARLLKEWATKSGVK